jgi:hypothetical protein
MRRISKMPIQDRLWAMFVGLLIGVTLEAWVMNTLKA